MNRMQWYGPTFLLLVTVVVVLVAGPHVARNIQWQHTDANISLIHRDLSDSQFLGELSDAFRKVALAVEPSVVYVQVLAHPRINAVTPFGAPPSQYDAYEQIGSGSGWVYDEQGHIVTNEHVVRSAERLRVRFSNGAEYDASILSVDPATDVAVLRVDAADLHPAKIADERPEQGDIVFAFGSPFHFDFSMSQGIVSGQGRTLGWLQGHGGYENYIQTDAAINPGNSGGPLTNIRGEVIGMNAAIASRDGDNDGVGFAIPVYMVRNVVDQLIARGEVRRGFLGVRLPDTDLDDRTARAFGFDGHGVLVQDLTAGGPAQTAGLRPGDIVVQINSEEIQTIAQLRYLVSSYEPGETVHVSVFREGRTVDLDVTLGELPAMNAPVPREMNLTPPGSSPAPGSGSGSGVPAPGLAPGTGTLPGAGPGVHPMTLGDLERLGVEEMVTFTDDMAARAGIDMQKGVWIERVRPGSVAAAAGLRGGMMVITAVGSRDVTDLASLQAALKAYATGDAVRLRISRYSSFERKWVNMFAVVDAP